MTMDPHQKEGLVYLQKQLRNQRSAGKGMLENVPLSDDQKRMMEGQLYGLNSCLTILAAIIMDDQTTQEEITENAKLQ